MIGQISDYSVLDFNSSSQHRDVLISQGPVTTVAQFMTMRETQILARAIGNQKENWGEPRIFKRQLRNNYSKKRSKAKYKAMYGFFFFFFFSKLKLYYL